MVCILRKYFPVYNFISGLAYSNIFIAAEAISMAFITIKLSGLELRLEPLLIPFASFFIIYNMDRYLGMEEDEENMPSRTMFVRKYGKFFFTISIIGYIIALILSLSRGSLVFALTVFPVLLSLAYSPLNLKKYLFLGNSIVGVAWGTIPLFVGAYYGDVFTAEALFLSGFFTLSWFRNATIFDIKDIKGDLKEEVKTVPNQYGIINTKALAVVINLLLGTSWCYLIVIGFLSPNFVILSVFHTYMFVYLQLVDMESGEFFYSVVIDGECKFLASMVLIASLTGVI